jgi:hypothetical protein
VLVIHETHRVAGKAAEQFADLFRTGWDPALAAGGGARLLWFLEQVHGTGPSYTFITLTGLGSIADLGALDERVRHGDLREWRREVDGLRHHAVAKVLAPTPFSPLTALDLDAVPPAGATDHGVDLPLFMEDTAWPHPGMLDAYFEKAGTLYLETLEKNPILELVGAFTPMFGAGPAREVVLWQRISRPEYLGPLFRREVTPEHKVPGTWMHDALDVRDQWESRLLRVASWSPLG